MAVPVGKIADDVVEGLVKVGSAMRVGPTDGGAEVDMGPLVSKQHRDRVASYLDVAKSEGPRSRSMVATSEFVGDGFLLGPSVVDRVTPTMRLAKEEDLRPRAFGRSSR